MIDFSLTAGQESLRKGIIRFAQEKLNKNVIDRDRTQTFSRELWEECGKMGLPGLSAPEEYGGGGLDCVSTALACEALGYGCTDGGLAFSLFAHLLTCVVPICKYGTDEQKERYLPGLCDGRLIGGNAMSEPGSGSDAFDMKTKAIPDGNGFRLQGTKAFCTNAPVADVLLVFAVTDPQAGSQGGITAFLVDRGTHGFQIGRHIEKSGLRTSPMAEVAFQDVYLSAGAVLGGVGGGSTVFAHSMNLERTCLFAGHVGVLERLLGQAVAYANSRKQRGKPIGKFQAISHRIADQKIRLEAARLLVYNAAWRLDNRRGATMAASIAKTFVSEALVQATAETLRIFGGYGFMTEFEVERIHRDSIGSTIYSGTNEIQREMIARLLGL